jgi:hypothetical protein
VGSRSCARCRGPRRAPTPRPPRSPRPSHRPVMFRRLMRRPPMFPMRPQRPCRLHSCRQQARSPGLFPTSRTRSRLPRGGGLCPSVARPRRGHAQRAAARNVGTGRFCSSARKQRLRRRARWQARGTRPC